MKELSDEWLIKASKEFGLNISFVKLE